jgi:hypothetical protein
VLRSDCSCYFSFLSKFQKVFNHDKCVVFEFWKVFAPLCL